MNKTKTTHYILWFWLLLVAMPISSLALVINVTNTNDSGPGSLRQAVSDARISPESELIQFDQALTGQTLFLTSGPIDFSNWSDSASGAVFISGLGRDKLTISGSNSSPAFTGAEEVKLAISSLKITDTTPWAINAISGFTRASGELRLQNCTITNNNSSPFNSSAIETTGDLEVSRCVITSNNSSAIKIETGKLTVFQSMITDNEGYGIRAGAFGTVDDGEGGANTSIRFSTISNNGGAGIVASEGSLLLSNSTVSNNGEAAVDASWSVNLEINESTLANNGQGISYNGLNNIDLGNANARLVVTNTTISGNAGTSIGGGIHVEAAQDPPPFGSIDLVDITVTLTNTTITNNSATEQGGGILIASRTNVDGTTTAEVFSSIIAGNSAPINPDVAGDFISNGFNLIGDAGTSSGFEADTIEADITKILNTALNNNGGPTKTHLLVANSPAIDAVIFGCPEIDQRRIVRPRTGCDIGAVELEQSDVPGDQMTLSIPISTGQDDVEEKEASGIVIIGSLDLDFVRSGGNQTVGLRFNGLSIPQGAMIANAYIQFTANDTRSETTSLTIEGEAVDNAMVFARANGNVSSRPRTTSSVAWVPAPWTIVGEAGNDQRTSDLSSIVQEIVNRSGWTSNNSLAFIISGTGKRDARSFEGSQADAPVLHIEYADTGSGSNTAPTVSVISPSTGDNFTAGDSISFNGTSSDVEDGNLTASLSWSSNLDGVIGNGGSFSTSFLSEGTHTITATTADSDGLPGSDSITITIIAPGGQTTLSIPISEGLDDVEEKAAPNDNVILGSLDLDFVRSGGNQTVGLRFNGLSIPPGAIIANAYIQFTANATRSETTSLTIEGEAVDNAMIFTRANGNVSSRPRTTSSAAWLPAPWTTVSEAGNDQRTVDLSSIVQEIVNRSGWASNNSLAFIISGTGKRDARSFEGSQADAPVLNVTFQ